MSAASLASMYKYAASFARSFQAPSPIPQIASSNPHLCIMFEQIQAGDKTADSA